MSTSYRRGKKARDDGASKLANPYQPFTSLWAWWLAGWNDRDMEIA